MIGSILMCDDCGRSVEVGAKPRATGVETRKADARGSIRRLTIGVRIITHPAHPPYRPERVDRLTIRRDLCMACAKPERLAEARRSEAHRATKLGYQWEDAR